jgi:hypothetical protein
MQLYVLFLVITGYPPVFLQSCNSKDNPTGLGWILKEKRKWSRMMFGM